MEFFIRPGMLRSPGINRRGCGLSYVTMRSRDVKVEDFESAALPHLKDLFRTAARLTGSRTEAQDIVQNVYLHAWRTFYRFEPGTNCRAWLFKILVNEIRHHRRTVNTSREVEDDGSLVGS